MTTTPKVKKKPGKPPMVMTPKMLKDAEKFAAQGLNQEQIALSLGISGTCFYKQKRINEQFAQACKSGQAKGIQNVSNVLYEKALTGDNASMMFYLKCRGGNPWREKHEVEVKASGFQFNVNLGNGK